MKRISSLLLATGLVLAMAVPAGAYEAFRGFLGVLQNEANATPGYILHCPYDSKGTYLMDKDGNVVNVWWSDHVGFYAELLPNGNMARHARVDGAWPGFGGHCGLIEEFDWEGNVVWSHAINERGKEVSHHTFEVMPNGNYMILVWEYKTYEEAVAKGLSVSDVENGLRNLAPGDGVRGYDGQPVPGIWPDVIREVDRDHNTVWEFHVWDNTGAEDNYNGWNINKYIPRIQSAIEAGPDWTHFNGVAYNPRTNQVVCTSRALGEFYVINYDTKEVVYRWGNPYNWGNGIMSPGYADDGDQILFGPHAPDWTVDNTVTVLHNATNRPTGPNTGFYEVDPATDTLLFDWGSNNVGVQKGTYYSSHQSGVNKMPNGHYLLTLTTGGSVIEIAPDKSIVWEFVNPIRRDQIYMTSSAHGQTGDGLHRSMFYAPDWPGFAGKDMSVMFSLPNWVDELRIDPVAKAAPR